MKTPTHTFRLDKATIRLMDRLITNPPAILLDSHRGAPRNRTELVEVLVKKASEMQQGQHEKPEKG